MRILLAPDSFKGSISATELCSLLAQPLRRAGHSCSLLPLADGGEGSLEALAQSLPLLRVQGSVAGPLGEATSAFYLWDAEANVAYIELAQAAGLHLLDTPHSNCLHSSTLGTGQQLLHAMERGAERIVLFVGGSATNDGGMGIAQALGYRMLDAQGMPLQPIGRNLPLVAEIDASGAVRTDDIEFIVATDVRNPLYGEYGAAFVFGPQKGASPSDIELLDRGLRQINQIWQQQWGLDLQQLPGAGAAGGAAAGMVAFCGAELQSGAELLFELCQVPKALAQTDWLVTGEGRLDTQSLQGKLLSRLLALPRPSSLKVVLLCGHIALTSRQLATLHTHHQISLARNADDVPESIRQVHQRIHLATRELLYLLGE